MPNKMNLQSVFLEHFKTHSAVKAAALTGVDPTTTRRWLRWPAYHATYTEIQLKKAYEKAQQLGLLVQTCMDVSLSDTAVARVHGVGVGTVQHLRDSIPTVAAARQKASELRVAALRTEAHPKAKLSDEDVAKIRYMRALGYSHGAIAAEMDTPRATIQMIANNVRRS